jgi:hypothetical protein
MLRHLENLENWQPTILPPAKKLKRDSHVNGNLNSFAYDESTVYDFLKLAATGDTVYW